jgi:transcription initiation factor TFIID subunit TAF12
MADDFVEKVIEFACQLAKHRQSDALEPRDLKLSIGKCNILNCENGLFRKAF